jgi:ribosome-associated protein
VKLTRKTAKLPPGPSEPLAKLCREIALDKKADDVLVLDVRGISTVTDYFVIATGNSEPHLKAIADEITRRLRESHHRRPRGQNGYPPSRWVVLDYGDLLVHVFHPELRARYALETLWGDGRRVA